MNTRSSTGTMAHLEWLRPSAFICELLKNRSLAPPYGITPTFILPSMYGVIRYERTVQAVGSLHSRMCRDPAFAQAFANGCPMGGCCLPSTFALLRTSCMFRRKPTASPTLTFQPERSDRWRLEPMLKVGSTFEWTETFTRSGSARQGLL